MIRKLIASVMFAAFTLGAAHAAESRETALEVIAGALTLPASDPGILVMKACSSCKEYKFETSSDTTYEIGETHVRLDVMRHELAIRSREALLLQLTPDRKSVARIYIAPAGQ